MSTTVLGWILCAVLLAAFVVWLAYVRPWQAGALESQPSEPVDPIGTAEPASPD